jgi:GNAT superfamily N-acetyltransferase
MDTVRRGLPTDAAAISALVRNLIAESLVDPEGEQARRFLATLEPLGVATCILMPSRFYAVAEVNGAVEGMIMVRDAHHVGQFFVSPAHQGAGIGSALWCFALANAKQAGGSGAVTVRSSVAAEPFYRKLGFVSTGPVEVQQGFRFVPMRREAGSAASRSG